MISKSEAIALFQIIPAVAAVYTPAHNGFVDVLLEATKGTTKDDPPQDFYRVWMAAYRYLQQSPALFRIKRHDRTELGSYESPLAMLLEQQLTEDTLNDLIVPPGQSPVTGGDPVHYTVSIRATTEFF
jgi:hypothetical protein